MAWLWSKDEFFCSMLSLRDRERWNLTNSTLTLRESFLSLSERGLHWASLTPFEENNNNIYKEINFGIFQ
jgi:hypothetical protein